MPRPLLLRLAERPRTDGCRRRGTSTGDLPGRCSSRPRSPRSLVVVPSGSDTDVRTGGCSANASDSAGALGKPPRIGLPASTSAIPATVAKEVRWPTSSGGPTVDHAEMRTFGELEDATSSVGWSRFRSDANSSGCLSYPIWEGLTDGGVFTVRFEANHDVLDKPQGDDRDTEQAKAPTSSRGDRTLEVGVDGQQKRVLGEVYEKREKTPTEGLWSRVIARYERSQHRVPPLLAEKVAFDLGTRPGAETRRPPTRRLAIPSWR
jgi:hypothetical protein